MHMMCLENIVIHHLTRTSQHCWAIKQFGANPECCLQFFPLNLSDIISLRNWGELQGGQIRWNYSIFHQNKKKESKIQKIQMYVYTGLNDHTVTYCCIIFVFIYILILVWNASLLLVEAYFLSCSAFSLPPCWWGVTAICWQRSGRLVATLRVVENVALWLNLENNWPWLFQSEWQRRLWMWNTLSVLTSLSNQSVTAGPPPPFSGSEQEWLWRQVRLVYSIIVSWW